MDKIKRFIEKMKEGKETTLNLNGVKYEYFNGFLIKIKGGDVFAWVEDKWECLTDEL